MELKQYKLFVYDDNLRPDNFLKICNAESILYEPAFAELRLTKSEFNGYNAIDSSWSRNTHITFGTLYTVNLSHIQWENIKLYYEASNIKKLSIMKVKCIRFDSIKDFLIQKFEVVDETDALCFILDLSSEIGAMISRDRHLYAGSICKEFLQTYRNY